MRTLIVDEELKRLATTIVAQGLDESQWAEVEADDMFQTESYAGGFDATERAFCFSFFDTSALEYWFQLTLSELTEVAQGVRRELSLRIPL